MKKDTAVIAFTAAVLVLFGGLFAVRFLLGGGEDTWLCESGQWVQHGNPSKSKPPAKECMVGGAELTDEAEEATGLANPAAVYCEKQGGELRYETDAKGTAGFCILPDGTECEEWAYFRGECPAK